MVAQYTPTAILLHTGRQDTTGTKSRICETENTDCSQPYIPNPQSGWPATKPFWRVSGFFLSFGEARLVVKNGSRPQKMSNDTYHLVLRVVRFLQPVGQSLHFIQFWIS